MSCATIRKASRIFVSKSQCIFNNLAFEENLFRGNKVEHALLLWRNRPCVVVGRHQNPWLEINVPEAERRDVDIVRRHSGGGTVYHDLGNVNVSFLTSHAEHCRPKNLEFLVRTLNKAFGLQGKKVSGTAARIARSRAYHHLTLLLDSDREAMHSLLHSPFEVNSKAGTIFKSQITTNATRSVRAAAGVGFIKDSAPEVSFEKYTKKKINLLKTCPLEYVDVDRLAAQEKEVSQIKTELLDWKWRFGKTPKFVLGKFKIVNGIVIESPLPELVGQKFSHTFLYL